MSYKILVPLDGSRLSEVPLQLGQALARIRSAQLKLLRVVGDDEDVAVVEKYLATRLAALGNDLEVTTEAMSGSPTKVLGNCSEWVDLILMGSHGRSGFDRMFLGSVTEKVVRHSSCPVMVFRGEPMKLQDIKRIMVPLDGSELALKALPHACRLCQETGSVLVLCRVEDSPGLDVSDVLSGPEEEEEILEDYRRGMGDDLDPSLKVECLYNFGSPARTIARMSEQHNIDILVMSTHGIGGLQRLVLGSVAEALLRASEIPILLIPHSSLGTEG